MSRLHWGSADAVFDGLEGAWDLVRTIEKQATMTGIAVFTPDHAKMLKYREDGRIRLADGRELDAHREYRFERAADALAGSAAHLCTPDTYDSNYRFLGDGSFTIRHTVRGPRKAYVSATVFRRRPAP